MIQMFIPSVDGDCQLDIKGTNVKKSVSLTSVSWEMAREFKDSAKVGSLDLMTGVVEMPPIDIEKSVDVATPVLMKYAASGGTFSAEIEIYFLQSVGANDASVDWFMYYKLDKALIKKWSVNGSEDDRPTESLSVWYNKVEAHYRPFDGSKFGAETVNTFDRVAGKVT